MTTIKIRTGNGYIFASVLQSHEDITQACDACTGENITAVFTQSGEKGCSGRYDKDTNTIHYTGGRIYSGLGAALGWEHAIQIGPDCCLFEFV